MRRGGFAGSHAVLSVRRQSVPDRDPHDRTGRAPHRRRCRDRRVVRRERRRQLLDLRVRGAIRSAKSRMVTSPRFITFPNAPAGTYHFTVTGTADGPLQLSAETLFGGTRVLLGEFQRDNRDGRGPQVRAPVLADRARARSPGRRISRRTPTPGDDLQRADGRRRSGSTAGARSTPTARWRFVRMGLRRRRTATGSPPAARLRRTRRLHGHADGDRCERRDRDRLRPGAASSCRNGAPSPHASGPYVGFASTRAAMVRAARCDGDRRDPNGDAADLPLGLR